MLLSPWKLEIYQFIKTNYRYFNIYGRLVFEPFTSRTQYTRSQQSPLINFLLILNRKTYYLKLKSLPDF